MGKSHGRALRVSDSGNQPLLDHHEEAGKPAKRELTKRQLRYMLRLHHDGVSAREIGRMLGVAGSTIQDNLRRALVQKADAIAAARNNYRKQWDERNATFRAAPVHNDYSHGADALMTGAIGYDPDLDPKRKRRRSRYSPLRITSAWAV